jgi:Family of unknown function (DUF5994)
MLVTVSSMLVTVVLPTVSLRPPGPEHPHMTSGFLGVRAWGGSVWRAWAWAARSTVDRGSASASPAAAPTSPEAVGDGPNSRRQATTMSDPDPSHETKLLPDEIHQAVRPGTALLRLQTTHDRTGILDGAWWPRSRDIGAELPRLITALTEHLGPLTRVGLDAGAWEELPTRLIVDDRVVHIDSSPVGDDTVLITRGDRDLFSLLVVPPHATPDAARAAMARSVRADNVTQAAQILIDTGTGRARPIATEAP